MPAAACRAGGSQAFIPWPVQTTAQSAASPAIIQGRARRIPVGSASTPSRPARAGLPVELTDSNGDHRTIHPESCPLAPPRIASCPTSVVICLWQAETASKKPRRRRPALPGLLPSRIAGSRRGRKRDYGPILGADLYHPPLSPYLRLRIISQGRGERLEVGIWDHDHAARSKWPIGVARI